MEHGVNEHPSGASVAVGEGVDRLELGVSQCDMLKNGNVSAMAEVDQVLKEFHDPVGVRRDDGRSVGCWRIRSDPDLPRSPGAWFSVVGTVQQGPVDGQHGVQRQFVGEVSSTLHGIDVGGHERGIGACLLLEGSQGKSFGTCRDVLDLRGRSRLRAQQDG